MDVMDMGKEKGKKGLILTTWERCKSIGRNRRSNSSSSSSSMSSPIGIKRFLTRKTKSWPRMKVESSEEENNVRKGRVAPEGCFSVYVGPERQRFVIKTEYANHPLFRMLLEEAEAEYGFNSQAPLSLPCNVDMFYRVMMEMDDGSTSHLLHGRACGYIPNRSGSYHLLTPSRTIIGR